MIARANEDFVRQFLLTFLKKHGIKYFVDMLVEYSESQGHKVSSSERDAVTKHLTTSYNEYIKTANTPIEGSYWYVR